MKPLKVVIGYLICAVLFLLGLLSITGNFSPVFEQADEDLAEGRALILRPGLQADSLSRLLLEGGYMEDPADARLAASWIVGRINELDGIENLGQINTRQFKIPADTALRFGGPLTRSRVDADSRRLGVDEDYKRLSGKATERLTMDSANATITVRISNGSSVKDAPLKGIPVRLRQHRRDSIPIGRADEAPVKKAVVNTETIGYALTDADGKARFDVPEGYSYSVLPILPGYQYGVEKGTTASILDGDADFSFTQSRQVITPLDNSTFQAIKSDRSLLVRSPGDWRGSLYGAAAIFLVGWLLLIIVTFVRDRLMKTSSDYVVIFCLMALTGIGLLASFAINNPLTDKPNGHVTAVGLAIGLAAMAFFSCINFVKYYNGRSRLQMGILPFDAVDSLITRRLRQRGSLREGSTLSLSSGFMYLLLALALIAMLALFGTGPEGSDARVNLGSFQPSELCKYLIIFFIAAFFAENADLIQEFSAKATKVTLKRQLGVMAVVIGVMLLLMFIYLTVLSDMGPALVLLVTFILMYSMARRDLMQMVVGLTTFIAMMMTAWALDAPLWVMLLVAALWFGGWIAYGWLRKRRIYESAIFLNLLIIAFALGGYILQAIGADSEAARLLNRTDMAWGGAWHNEVPGGDQVAQGLWSLASGGLTGMGLGNGSPSLVPACHTDMIFTSIGEMLGLFGLLLVIICFVALVRRAMIIGWRAAHPFVMYLVFGLAIATGVQFLLIVMGSLGLVPLTGISLPLVSYGRTGLIITLGVMGIIVSASRLVATESQLKAAAKYQYAVAGGVLLFLAGGIIVVCSLLNYQVINRKETLIRPAVVNNLMGAGIIEYNPRIALTMNRMHSGSIYDRNGLLLATSSREEFLEAIPSLVKAGLNEKELRRQANKRRRRYYPFGNHALFMTGDANTRKVYSFYNDNPTGYLAEYRHFSDLRGFDVPSKAVQLTSDNYRENRFMPPTDAVFSRRFYDYSIILPYLDYGLDRNPLIEEHNANRDQRDIRLTVDAALQTALQNALASGLKAEPLLQNKKDLRASVVVLNAAKGDLISSANYPLPDQDTIAKFSDMRIFAEAPAEKIPGHAPITERDLGMTYMTMPGSTAKVMSAMAGLMNGTDAALRSYRVDYPEIIHKGEPSGNVSMHDAIVRSSNNYFINSVNDQQLYPNLGLLYRAVGAGLSYDIGKNPRSSYPYFLTPDEYPRSAVEFDEILGDISAQSYRTYKMYLREREPGHRLRRANRKWNWWASNMPWGQGALRATPLTMARVASIPVNGGQLTPTRFLLQKGKKLIDPEKEIDIMPAESARLLKSMMIDEAAVHTGLAPYNSSLYGLGGKTGTPERERKDGSSSNDAWYIFFLQPSGSDPLSVAVRLERTEDRLSGVAVKVVHDIVMPVLRRYGYTN